MANILNVDLLVQMSQGNPGAAMALADLAEIKPDYILLIDSYGIKGSDIYVLYSDICGRDVFKMIGVLKATHEGRFDLSILKDACSRQDYSGRALVPVDQLCAA